MATVPATVVAGLATDAGAPGESETPVTAAYWVPEETYPDLNPIRTGPAPQLFEDILSELRTTIIRNLQHNNPEAVASDAAFLIKNQLFGYDNDVDNTDLWGQLREVINEGQVIKKSKYPEYAADWRLGSLSKYLRGHPKIDDAKWAQVKEALNSVSASYDAVNAAKRGPTQERAFEDHFNNLESKKAVLEDPTLLLPIYVQYLNLYIFSLRQGISLARKDVPETTEDWGLGSVWRAAKVQQLKRVIDQARARALEIYDQIQKPGRDEIAKQVGAQIPEETQSAVESRFRGQSIISWLTGRPNYSEHYNAWKAWDNFWNPRENFLTRYVLDFVDIWEYARTFEPQRVRLTREIFTVAGDPAGTAWLRPFPPTQHTDGLPTSIEIWAGDSNRATDLVDAIQVHYPNGGDDKQDFDRLKPIVLGLIGGSAPPPPPRTANLRVRALDLGGSPIVKVSIRHHQQNVRGSYSDFRQVHRIELVDTKGKVYHAGPKRDSDDTQTEDFRAFSGRVLSSVVALGITDKWFSSIRLGWRLAEYA